MAFKKNACKNFNCSILVQAYQNLLSLDKVIKLARVLPLPLIGLSVLGFFYFQPLWYKDIFLWSILILFVAGQSGALFQLSFLGSEALRTTDTLKILKEKGAEPDLELLQKELVEKSPPCNIRENILNCIQLGLQGETDGLERIMDQFAFRRDQISSKILGFHNLVTRITLKLGFLGTLIGLLMTFEPMKQAMLSLKGSRGDFQFVNDIVKAIDGNAYAILTTMFATALSIFIELLTIQIMEKVFSRFEAVNNDLEDWCIVYLKPWIKDNYGKTKNSIKELVENQKVFTEKIISLNKLISDQINFLTMRIEETGFQMEKLLPLEKNLANKINRLTSYESEYREFINSKIESLALPFLRPEKTDE